MSGKGVLCSKNGERYEGYFKNDKMHGEGKLVQGDGSISKGTFEYGRKHGFFTEIDAEGQSREV
jgi:hypothetical protein